jgi:hypothetical protein
MKSTISKTILILLAVISYSCVFNDYPPNSKRDNKTVELDKFTGIDISDAMNVTIVESSNFKIKAEGYSYDLENLSIRVRNGVLIVYCQDKNWFRNNHTIDLTIEMPTIDYLQFSGAVEGVIENLGVISKLEIKLSGASTLNVETKTERLFGKLTGASELKLNNTITKIDLSLSGASELLGYEANSKEAYLDLSGASEARVSVSDLLKVSASGGSEVIYKGNPVIEKDLSGSSSLRKY